MISAQKTTPTVVASAEITSADTYATYGALGKFSMQITAVSEPVKTKDVKLVTSWTTSNRTNPKKTVNGGVTINGASFGTSNNTKYQAGGMEGTDDISYEYNSPLGFGPGVTGTAVTGGQYGANQFFGNYTLMEGLRMESGGYYSPYNSTTVKSLADKIKNVKSGNAMEAILGKGWTDLKPGDEVSLSLIYAPSGGVLYSETIVVK